MLGVLAVVFQSLIGVLMDMIGAKRTVILGLFCESLYLLWFSFSTYDWLASYYLSANYLLEFFLHY